MAIAQVWPQWDVASRQPCTMLKKVGSSMADLVHPVRVEDPKATKLAPCPLLCHTFQVPCGLQLCDTLPHGLTIHNTLHAKHRSAEGAVQTVDCAACFLAICMTAVL